MNSSSASTPISVSFVVDEAYPLYKIGGLGDVGGSLPKALAGLGVDIEILLPQHPSIKSFKPRSVSTFSLPFANHHHQITVTENILPHTDIPVFLFAEPKIISLESDASDTQVAKFALFSLAVFHWLTTIRSSPLDIIHLQDWHTALITLLSEHSQLTSKTILTIHNLAFQGKTTQQLLKDSGLPTHNPKAPFNFMGTGITHADYVTTVSPTYAQEILTPEYAEGLLPELTQKKSHLSGILNGIDTEVFNPTTDPNLFHRYDRNQALSARTRNKQELKKLLGIHTPPDQPLIGFVGRVDPHQKGIDLILELLQQDFFNSNNLDFVFLGTGDHTLEAKLQPFHSATCHLALRYDEVLASRIYSAAELMLIPSAFEPCGLVQLIAMRYGSLPVARKTGGLADTITHQQTGFLFKPYTTAALAQATLSALEYIKSEQHYHHMISTAMAQDFSWKNQASKYLDLYHQLLT